MEMATRRGTSRFSKALPTPPERPLLPVQQKRDESPASISTSLHSPLPPFPVEKMQTASIPRRPVGGPTLHTKTPSRESVSSIYSDSPGFSRSLSNSSRQTKDSISGVDSEIGLTPPLPPKDEQRKRLPKISSSTLASPISKLHSSPPRPEIWRRRSQKSDKAISFSELKLEKSNGSTASPPQGEPPNRSLPAIPTQLPRSITGRKPVPARPAPKQPDLMGDKLSKLKDNDKDKKGLGESRRLEAMAVQNPSFNRLPTPEYLKTERQESMIPQVLSPVSPETPPNENPPQVPLKSESRATLHVTPLANTTNRPNLLSSHSRDSSETLTITSEPSIMRSPQPKKAFAARILTPQPSPSPQSEETSPLAPPPPASMGVKFPTLPSPAAEGTVVPGAPLTSVHFDCYQSHKLMRSSRNTLCPVACMVCEKKDNQTRWCCNWCTLRVCGSCMQLLATIPGKDLKVCLKRIGR